VYQTLLLTALFALQI